MRECVDKYGVKGVKLHPDYHNNLITLNITYYQMRCRSWPRKLES